MVVTRPSLFFRIASTLVDARRGLAQKVTILGVPCNKGQKKSGVDRGPEAIRKGGLVEALQSVSRNIEVVDYGDITYQPLNLPEPVNYHNLAHVAACQKEVSHQVAEIVSSGRLCLTLGGDHSLAAGSIDGVVKATAAGGKLPVVLWIDAHSDLNTSQTSGSGNPHGMPVALLASEISGTWLHSLPSMEWLVPRLSLKDFAYIGLRDVDPDEAKFLEQYNVAAYSMEEVERHGVSAVVEAALRRVDPQSDRPVHLSFDIDALDVLEAPATGTPVRGGLSLREGVQIVESVYRTGRLVAVDVVEVNPELGGEDDVRRTVQAAIAICKAAVGLRRRLWPAVDLQALEEVPVAT